MKDLLSSSSDGLYNGSVEVDLMFESLLPAMIIKNIQQWPGNE